jgi:hypothetical protein
LLFIKGGALQHLSLHGAQYATEELEGPAKLRLLLRRDKVGPPKAGGAAEPPSQR